MKRRSFLLGAAAALSPARLWAQAAGIGDLVADVSPGNLRRHVVGLSSIPTRWTGHPGFPAIEQWIADAFRAQGAAPVRQAFRMPSGKTRHNILVGGPRDPRDMLIVGAHFDSTSETPRIAAPGAYDNASGVAAMLETQRILGRLALARQVVFLAFAAEEQGVLGSTHAAETAAREGWPVHFMLNLDMLGRRAGAGTDPLIIEYDQGNRVAGNDADARRVALRAARLAAEHTDLDIRHTDIWGSDYMPFEAHGFTSFGLFDGGTDAAEYHTTRDLPERVDFRRLEQITRLVVAIVADAAGPAI